MAYPGFPFPPGTPLYPSHEHVEAYHLNYAKHYQLLQLIKFNHQIVKAEWNGSEKSGAWDLKITTTDDRGETYNKRADHLIVATGNNHIPFIPSWRGQDQWLSDPLANHPRKIVHSVYYREPAEFKNQSVLVIGNGGSGRDAAIQVVGFAKQVRFTNLYPPNY